MGIGKEITPDCLTNTAAEMLKGVEQYSKLTLRRTSAKASSGMETGYLTKHKGKQPSKTDGSADLKRRNKKAKKRSQMHPHKLQINEQTAAFFVNRVFYHGICNGQRQCSITKLCSQIHWADLANVITDHFSEYTFNCLSVSKTRMSFFVTLL